MGRGVSVGGGGWVGVEVPVGSGGDVAASAVADGSGAVRVESDNSAKGTLDGGIEQLLVNNPISSAVKKRDAGQVESFCGRMGGSQG